jgi:VCBS repeat-containing protein
MEDRSVPATVTVQALADAREGGAGGAFRYSRDGDTGQATTVSVSYGAGSTATPGSDYSFLPGQVSFAAGSDHVDVTVWPTDDGTSEPTETVVATIMGGGGMTIGTPSTATVNIFDNDPQVVTVAKVSDATEGGADGLFRFTRIGDLSGVLSFDYSVSGSSTASGSDYTLPNGPLAFTAGSATTDVQVQATADNLVEGDETLIVNVASGTGYTVGTPSSATLTIHDGPTAADDSFSGDEDTEITGNVLDNDTDPQNDTLTATLVDGPWFGSLTLNSDGSFSYTPDANFYGTDQFTYQVSNSAGGTNTATATITVNAVDGCARGSEPVLHGCGERPGRHPRRVRLGEYARPGPDAGVQHHGGEWRGRLHHQLRNGRDHSREFLRPQLLDNPIVLADGASQRQPHAAPDRNGNDHHRGDAVRGRGRRDRGRPHRIPQWRLQLCPDTTRHEFWIEPRYRERSRLHRPEVTR